MRTTSLAGGLAIGVFALMFTWSAGLAADAPKSAAVQSNSKSAGHWYRTLDGRSVWIADKVETAKSPSQAPAQTNTALRVTVFRPIVITTYPNSGPTETLNGIEWYLNGRSYFSD